MFKRIYIFFVTFMAAFFFTHIFIVFWLSQNGFNFSSLIIYYLLMFFVALMGILYCPQKIFTAKKALFWGVAVSLISILLLTIILSPIQLYLSSILAGFAIIFFWIPYNIMFFKYSREDRRGFSSGIYFLIMPIIGMTLQPLAGIMAEKFGFELMFALGSALYFIPLFLIRFLPDFEWELNIKKELKVLKFNWTTFFQGMFSRINSPLIPIFTLFFIKTPSNFGSFFGYLALLAVVASIINGYISDKMKNRKYFFYTISSLAVLSFLPLAFAEDAYYWALFAGISSLCIYLVNPISFTFNLDYYKEVGVEKTMILREVFLGLGYVFSLLIIFFVFQLTSSPKISLMVIAIICCFYPIVAYLQGVYRKKVNAI